MSDKRKKKIMFSYRESPAFRNVHATGIYGGVTVNGDIYMGVYVDKLPVPHSSTLEIDENDIPVPPESFNTPTGRIREIEAGITMDVGLAKAVIAWLQEKIDAAEAATKTFETKRQ